MIDIYEYIALAIEFEGCISIGKSISKNESINYHMKVAVQNTNKELLEHFQNKVKFGQIFGPSRRPKENWKELYYWNMDISEIKKHLSKILPFLPTKWRQAELMIEANNIIISKKEYPKLSKKSISEIYTYDEFLTLEFIYYECKELNKKGKKK